MSPVTTIRRGRVVPAVALAAALLGSIIAAGVATAATDPAAAAAADRAATWLAGDVNAQGFVPGPTDDPDISSTLDIALAFAASRSQEATYDRIVAWTRGHTESIVVVNGNDDPGRLGVLMMLARTAGVDPADFGGVDLPARLAATLGDFSPGLYGAADPTYDGAFRQSLALMGLVASGVTPPAAAVQWLLDQQCDSPAAAAGGFLGYRADTSVDCPPPDPVNYTGPDTNSTSFAVQALAAVGQAGAVADALDFLADAEAADGGFGFVSGSDSDPNSEALVIQAIIAGGEDPTAGRWVKGTDNPFTALLSWQIDAGDPADVGAFATPFSNGFPDQFATRQAVWGASGEAFPLLYDPFPPSSSSSSSSSSTTTSTQPTAPAPTGAPASTGGSGTAAQTVSVTPRFAG